MLTSLRNAILFSVLSLGLVACGNSNSSGVQAWKNRSFVTQDTNQQNYNIEVRGQNFDAMKTANADFKVIAPTTLSRALKGAKLENQKFEVRLNDTKIIFDIDLRRGLRFNELDELGGYSINGFCVDHNCAQASMTLEDIDASEVAELLYSRSIEYLTSSDLKKLDNPDQKLIAEAIEYRFPVTRHSVRVNNSRDLDFLVIERPNVDEVQEDFSDIDDNKTRVVFDNNSVPFIGKRAARNNDQRVELSANQNISFTTNPTTTGTQHNFRLTPNPYEAYNLNLPSRFFSANDVIRNTQQLENHIAITPVAQQQNFEPALRIAAIAKAFAEQGVKIYRNACNIYVRSVMSLAGYTHGGHNLVSNEFHKLFKENSQGLNQWEERSYSLRSAADISRLRNDLRSSLDSHGFVAQVDRSSLGRYGHTGILVVEDGDLVIYDSSLDQRGPRRTVVGPEKLLNNRRPVLKLHSYPELMNP